MKLLQDRISCPKLLSFAECSIEGLDAGFSASVVESHVLPLCLYLCADVTGSRPRKDTLPSTLILTMQCPQHRATTLRPRNWLRPSARTRATQSRVVLDAVG